MNQNTRRRFFVRILLILSSIAAPFVMLATAGDTIYTYDALGRLRTVTRPDGAATTYTLDAAGNRTQVQEAAPVGAVPSIDVPGSSTNGNYTISWTAPAAGTVDRYELYEDTSPSFGSANRIYNNLAPRSLAVTGRLNGSYYYRVRACGPINCGSYAVGGPAVVTLPPAAPASISISGPSNNGSYSISWGAVTSGTATRYELWEANNSGFSGEARVYDNTGLEHVALGPKPGLVLVPSSRLQRHELRRIYAGREPADRGYDGARAAAERHRANSRHVARPFSVGRGERQLRHCRLRL